MNAVQAALLIAGGLVLIAATIAGMVWMNAKERRVIERRRAAWIAAGSNPEDEPNFFSGRETGNIGF